MTEDKAGAAQPTEKDQTVAVKKKKRTNPNPINIYRRWCKTCSICIQMCPHDVFDADRDGYPVVARPFDCTQCAICWLHCPDFAITSTEK